MRLLQIRYLYLSFHQIKRSQFGKRFLKSKSEEFGKVAMLVINLLGKQISMGQNEVTGAKRDGNNF
jgi:hypothetical protein